MKHEESVMKRNSIEMVTNSLVMKTGCVTFCLLCCFVASIETCCDGISLANVLNQWSDSTCAEKCGGIKIHEDFMSV